MSVLEKIISIIAPFNCLACGREGSILCASCRETLKPATSCCYRCSAPSDNFETCQGCLKETSLKSLKPAAAYGGTAKALVWRLKFTGAQAAAACIGEIMARNYLPDEEMLIVPVPTANKRARQRGYDQAALIAKNYARLANTTYLPCLARLGQQQQRGAKGDQRRLQLKDAYIVVAPKKVKGMRILLIDDVATTGATLEVAAATLTNAGALHVDALVFTKA